jgi:hypothetical protein
MSGRGMGVGGKGGQQRGTWGANRRSWKGKISCGHVYEERDAQAWTA